MTKPRKRPPAPKPTMPHYCKHCGQVNPGDPCCNCGARTR